MKHVPIPLILDLWACGHNARDIAEKLGLPDRDHVHRIVEHARDIGDPRAVMHVGLNGRPIGNGRRGMGLLLQFPDIELVPAIPKLKCLRGHLRTAETVTKLGLCRECARIRKRAERARK